MIRAFDGSLADAEACCQFGKGRRTKRKIALELIQQAELKRVFHQNPMRWARAVKKIPEGLSAAIWPSSAKFIVS